MKKIIKFKIEGWFYRDVKQVIDEFTANKSVKNNLWLATAYIYVKSNEKRQKPCQFVNMMFKDIRRHANSMDDDVLNQYLTILRDKKIITVNESYSSSLHYAKRYAVSLRYKEYLLDIFHAEQIVELKLTSKCLKEWDILTKEDMFNILNEEIRVEEKDLFEQLNKENSYEEYEKNSIGYHEGETETQKILRQRMLTNFNFDKEKIKEHINNSSDYFEEVNKLTRFIRSTKHKTYSSIHGRVYLNGYSNGSKEYRDTFKYDDNKLIELMDVKSCFVLLTILLARMQKKVTGAQIHDLYNTVVRADIYIILAELIYNKKEISDEERKQTKLAVLRWFFMSNEGKKKCGWSKDLTIIKNYFKTKYPAYYNFLVTYNEIEVGGKKKSCLAVDCQWLQNKLIINTLMKKFVRYKVVTLHDSIWISEDEWSFQLERKVRDYFEVLVKGIAFNYDEDEGDVQIERKLREDLIINYPNVSAVFNTYNLSRDFIRQIVNQLDMKNRHYFEAQLVSAAEVVKVLSIQFLRNSIIFLKDNMASLWKDALEQTCALQKFQYRYWWQKTPEYQLYMNNIPQL